MKSKSNNSIPAQLKSRGGLKASLNTAFQSGKSFLSILALVGGFAAFAGFGNLPGSSAQAEYTGVDLHLELAYLAGDLLQGGFVPEAAGAPHFSVGDKNTYSMDFKLFKGSMALSVREIVAEGVWVDQNVDFRVAKLNSSILINPQTGEILKLIAGGKEQTIPKKDMEVVESIPEEIKVPAGTFKTVHMKIREKGATKVVENWVNLAQVPINGLVKSIAPLIFMSVNVELLTTQMGPQ